MLIFYSHIMQIIDINIRLNTFECTHGRKENIPLIHEFKYMKLNFVILS